MIFKTEGIVIRNTNYSETSVISKIYTRQFGIQTYMINGVRNSKGAIKPSMLQPLLPLDMVVYHNNQKEIQRIKELKVLFPLQSIHFDVIKTTVILFASELLYHSVKEEEPNPSLFDFILSFIGALDESSNNIGIYPLVFALQLTAFLGFYPSDNFSTSMPNFLLSEGRFSSEILSAGDSLIMPESEYLFELLNKNIFEVSSVQIPRQSRQIMLESIMKYYSFHLPGFNPLKSLKVLNNLL